MHGLAAINTDGLTGNESGIGRCQEKRGSDQVFGNLVAADGAPGALCLKYGSGEVLDDGGDTVKPGLITLTVMPYLPTSLAKLRENPTMPAFAAT